MLPNKDVAATYNNDIASSLGITVAQLIGDEDIPKADLAWKFAHGQPLVRPEQVRHLPTQMRRLHEWYMESSKEGREILMVAVKRSISSVKTRYVLSLKNCFSYTIKTPSINLSSVDIVCK